MDGVHRAGPGAQGGTLAVSRSGVSGRDAGFEGGGAVRVRQPSTKVGRSSANILRCLPNPKRTSRRKVSREQGEEAHCTGKGFGKIVGLLPWSVWLDVKQLSLAVGNRKKKLRHRVESAGEMHPEGISNRKANNQQSSPFRAWSISLLEGTRIKTGIGNEHLRGCREGGMVEPHT